MAVIFAIKTLCISILFIQIDDVFSRKYFGVYSQDERSGQWPVVVFPLPWAGLQRRQDALLLWALVFWFKINATFSVRLHRPIGQLLLIRICFAIQRRSKEVKEDFISSKRKTLKFEKFYWVVLTVYAKAIISYSTSIHSWLEVVEKMQKRNFLAFWV